MGCLRPCSCGQLARHLGPHPQVTGYAAVCTELRLPGGSAGAGLVLLRACV